MKLHELSEIPGVRDLQTLLNFLENQEAFKERIEALQALRKVINEQIKDVGEIKDIGIARKAAAEDREKASAELASARDQAREMMCDVENTIKENQDKAKVLKAQESSLLKREQQLSSKEAAFAKKLEDAAEAHAREIRELEDAQARVRNLEVDLNDKRAKLKEAAAAV